MKFSDLYDNLIQAWPAEIPLLDASPPTDKAAQHFPKLSEVFRGIEEKIDFTSDHWSHVGQWAFSQVFHLKAMALYHEGILVLRPREIPAEELSRQVVRILESDDWAAERNVFRPFPQ
ncbi:hypothetical protein GN316_15145 [Xylophilus sp. Kf1]|nr:hypothetical protein [Xylophilus sp. Kf1]